MQPFQQGVCVARYAQVHWAFVLETRTIKWYNDGYCSQFKHSNTGLDFLLPFNTCAGLPATVTSCLAITAQRLRDRNVLIKRSDIVENLGAASVIASDKTGTLTQVCLCRENVAVPLCSY